MPPTQATGAHFGVELGSTEVQFVSACVAGTDERKLGAAAVIETCAVGLCYGVVR